MPAQTTVTGNVYFPDGAKVQVKESGAGSYTDIGVLGSDINLALNWDENEVISANAGTLLKQIRNMTVAGDFTLWNISPSIVPKLSGGLMETVTTAGASVSSIDDQVIASGAASDKTPYNLSIVETGGAALRVESSLVIAGVTGDTDGALTEDDDYIIIDDATSSSGKSIVFNTAGTALTTLAQEITVEYTSLTPVARTTNYVGTSTATLAAYAIKITHTDSNSKIREFEIFSADTNSGGFTFGFKGANSDGVEEMPISFTGKVDTGLVDGRQLFAWVIDEGAA